ncbi:MAG TPA: SdpI family protein [Armatimonadota bacterium]|jgi:uncharacterized membrane protein
METELREKPRPLLTWGGIILGLMLVLTAIGWAKIPAGQMIATHWGLNGQPDGYSGKTLALLIMPLVALAEIGFFLLILNIEPRRRNIRLSLKAYTAIVVGSLSVLLVAHALIILSALGYHLKIGLIMPLAIGALFIVIGNYLGKFRSNFFAGIRTPWTLSSDLAWDKTHRLGGKLFVLLGVILILVVFLRDEFLSFILLFAEIITVTLMLTIYSFLVWRSDPDRRGNGGTVVPENPAQLRVVAILTVLLMLLLPVAALVAKSSSSPAVDITPRAIALVNAISKGDYPLVERDFDGRMRAALPPEKLRAVWEETAARNGPFRRTDGTRIEKHWPFTAVIVTTEFTRASVDIKVVFSPAGKVSGLWLSPAAR